MVQTVGYMQIAYCTSLLNGNDPCDVIYDQREMRSHLANCFQSKQLTPFPVVRRRRFSKAHTSFITVAVCPNCKQPDTGSMMVYCESCTKWFHKQCVLPFDENDEDFNWLCTRYLKNDE